MRTEKNIIYKEETVMPLLALRGITVFPDMLLHFDVGRSKSKKALELAMEQDQTVFLVTQKDMRTDDPGPEDLFTTGTISKVRQLLKLPGGGIRVLVEGMERGRIVSLTKTDPYIEVSVSAVSSAAQEESGRKTDALIRYTKELYEKYAEINPHMGPETVLEVLSSTSAGYLADYIAQNSQMDFTDKQSILDAIDPGDRLQRVVAILTKEMEILKAEGEIQAKVREQIDKNQKEYVLREQLRAIQSELGEKDDITDEVAKYKAKINELIPDEESREKLLEDVLRLPKLGQNMAETGMLRTYLDTVLELPWKKTTKDRTNVEKASKILDKDHYGMEKVKERILEYIAVRQLEPNIKNQIICLVGPPGVGKTSVGFSIARALGRKLARVSLGGVRDEAEIRGHRKTYIGAMPGRIMTAMRQAGTKNPVLLLDEIDKLGSDYKGDPASALLEVLDSEQNHAFRDHYIEVPFDLSDVMFILTANVTDMIPRALMDRMEIIELPSYTDEEKVVIAKDHLIPKQLKRHGLTRRSVRITDEAIREIIEGYTREAGVRTLERTIASCLRKAAKEIAEGEEKLVVVDPEKVAKYLGPRKYKREKPAKENAVGLVNGLAWTSVGGELLEVEANVLKGTGKVELTGNLGDVMKESAKAAISYIRSRAESLLINGDFYKDCDIHVHFPEGAVPKDGPSAGITIVTAIVSALTCRAVYRDVAMTGEITLRGRVLPIGGLREKTMAAYRAGIKRVIIPAENEPDLYDIDKTVREGLQFIPVENADQVLAVALEPVKHSECADLCHAESAVPPVKDSREMLRS